MKYLYILLTLFITSVSCKPKTNKVISEEKKAKHTNSINELNNSERIIVIDEMKCKEIFDKTIGIYLIEPGDGCNATLNNIGRINLRRVTKRMNNLVYLLKMKCLEDCKESPEYCNAEYKRRFDKYLAQSEASFKSYLEAMGYLKTPDLIGFSGSMTYRFKDYYKIEIIKHRIVDLTELLHGI
jgi:hypothetical protein